MFLTHARVKFVQIADVVGLVILCAGEDEKHGARLEVEHFAPDHRADVKASIGPVEANAASLLAIIEHDRAASAHAHRELMQSLVSVEASLDARSRAKNIINARDLEGHVLQAFDRHQAAPIVPPNR